MIVLEILALLIVVAIVYGIVVYNRLTRFKYRVEAAWSDIDVQLKRRYNLIPNLVETVKGYAAHEAKTLEAVVEARNRAQAADGAPDQQAKAENALSGALRSLFALAEQYPNLKANENFLSLQRDLSEIEGHIQSARRYYNGTVRDNNTYVMQFPSNLIAQSFGFRTAEFFELDNGAERENVKVSF
ncbi:MAG: hypothetical protein DCC73_12875 [Proteobacteria bacterium]|nr:MAG: hypothetical protein DCC73_12875 [Pseudomonadota bacterium]